MWVTEKWQISSNFEINFIFLLFSEYFCLLRFLRLALNPKSSLFRTYKTWWNNIHPILLLKHGDWHHMANLGGSLTFGRNSNLCSSVLSGRANNPRKDRCSDLQPAFCNLPSCLRLAKVPLKFTRSSCKRCRRGSGLILGKIPTKKKQF